MFGRFLFGLYFFGFPLKPSLTICIYFSSIFSQFGWFTRGLCGSDSGNWSCPRIMKFFFRKCSMIVLRYFSLYLCVCVCFLFRCWESVKIKSFEFLDMDFDWLWWGFHLLQNKYSLVMGFSFIRFWENEGKKINFNLEILDFILINWEGNRIIWFCCDKVLVPPWYGSLAYFLFGLFILYDFLDMDLFLMDLLKNWLYAESLAA